MTTGRINQVFKREASLGLFLKNKFTPGPTVGECCLGPITVK